MESNEGTTTASDETSGVRAGCMACVLDIYLDAWYCSAMHGKAVTRRESRLEMLDKDLVPHPGLRTDVRIGDNTSYKKNCCLRRLPP